MIRDNPISPLSRTSIIYCSTSVAEMIAMKNDLTVEEVMTIKDVLPAAAIVQTRPEIPIEEAIALKANMTIGRNIRFYGLSWLIYLFNL